MSHYHHWFAQWKSLFDGVELLPQDSCRVWIGVTAGIAVEPNLVIAPEIHITPQIIQHWHPRDRCIHEAMDEKHDSFVWIVRFEADNPGGGGVFLRSKETGESKLLGLFTGKLEGICRREICRQWIGVPVHVHVLRGKGIVHRDDATRTFELRRRGNAVKDVWRTEERTGLLRGEGSLRNERRADPVLLHVVLHVGAFEIELIGRNQVVESQIPLWARITLPGESVLAISADPHGMCPWVQFRIPNCREDARNCEIVIVPCFCVRRVAIELAQ